MGLGADPVSKPDAPTPEEIAKLAEGLKQVAAAFKRFGETIAPMVRSFYEACAKLQEEHKETIDKLLALHNAGQLNPDTYRHPLDEEE